jgi:transcription-repair coupling factor (superfamily II helicase)
VSEVFPLERVLAGLRAAPNAAVDVSGVDAELSAYLTVALQAELKRPFVVVAPDAADARRIAADLEFFAGAATRVVLLPTVEASPYGDLSPDRGAVMELLAQLALLAWDQAGTFTVVSAEGLCRRPIPRDVLLDKSYLVVTGARLDRDACLRALADGGYHAVSTVEDPGTFAVRGGIIDVFPPHLDDPVRIELWGDDVDSVKHFRVDSQRTYGGSLESLMLPPVREELLVPPYRDNARIGILDAGAAAGVPSRKLQPLLADLSNGMPFMGIEGFRPAFYEQLGVLTDYLPAEAVLLLLDPLGVADKIRGVNELREREYADSLRDQMPALPAERHVQHLGELQRFFSARPCVRAHVLHIGVPGGGGGPDLGDDLLDLSDEPLKYEGPEGAIRFQVPNNRDLTHALGQARSDKEPLRPLAVAARDWSDLGACVLIACRQETQLDRLERVLKGYGVRVRRATGAPREYLHPPGSEAELGAVLVQGEVGGGFRLLEHGFALLTEDEIFGKKSHKRRKAARSDDPTSPFVQSFRELEPGDFVVHSDHGVGKYLGLKKLVVGTNETDFLVVEFAGADKLYLPVYKLGRLQKYVGPSENAPKIDKLGGTGWEKVRAKAEKTAEEDAFALLELYARRELAEGTAFTAPDDYFRSFEATFPFDETPDQARAIEEVLEDMQRARPMDRLLCGDVGFGKTEVALRAAMKAVVDAKQVAMLVPTTVLALQHYKTFKERFSQYPVRVELLSRGVHADQQKEIIKEIKLGRVDIVVGTHRVLSKDIVFRDLGLLVLDEEHRFGVKDKERLKEMRSNVDVLTMTATPIPRTLQLSLGGVRDLSVITTPPADRLSVRTYVCRQTDQVVREAIIRELARGGQVFFVHNRVQTIESRKAWLQALVPECRIVVGHGQMDPDKLEEVMLDFTEGKFNVLLSTTIIESGIDIPNANTMLVDHADNFGLAQLYQLRGRVGRSKARGYCYLLVASEGALTGDARKRLGVIQKFTELGSGFQVASHDLEIRGAGELLGTRQKGQIAAVGLDLYAQLLQDAVQRLRGEPPKVNFDPEISLKVTALLPEDYVPDTHLRLVMYKRLANANDEEDVLSVAEEMVDRFGPLPGQVENLVEVMRIRTLARYVGLNAVDDGGDKVLFTFHPQSPFPVSAVVRLVSAAFSRFRAPADFKLTYTFDAAEKREMLASVRMCLQRLAEMQTDALAPLVETSNA